MSVAARADVVTNCRSRDMAPPRARPKAAGRRWSDEARERPQSGEGGDERVGVAVGGGETQHESARAAHDTRCDVQEAHPEALSPIGAKGLGERKDAKPAGDIVGEGEGEPPQPVAEEVLHRSVVHGEVGLQLADGLLCGPTPKAVVVVDLDRRELVRGVGDEGEEAPSARVVEGELLALPLCLAAHDEAKLASGKAVGRLGHLRAGKLSFGIDRRRPGGGLVHLQRRDRPRTFSFCSAVMEKVAS